MIRTAKKFAMCLEGEQEPQPIQANEQHGQAHAQRLGKFRGCRSAVRFAEHRRYQHRDRCHEEQAGLKARAILIVFLHVMLEPADQKRHPQHE